MDGAVVSGVYPESGSSVSSRVKKKGSVHQSFNVGRSMLYVRRSYSSSCQTDALRLSIAAGY